MTTNLRSAGLFLYDGGLLNCFLVKQAMVHIGEKEANCSRGFRITEGRLALVVSCLLGFEAVVLEPLIIGSIDLAGFSPVTRSASPSPMPTEEKPRSKTFPPSGLTMSDIALPMSLIAMLDS
jgi:hypothetical protein